MSTFDGKVIEFPDIRIDYFRIAQNEVNRPLAFFLSHVHSDHLAGLETCKSPFIYCSPATREILLRLEKYPHRMNFAKGILEARKQTYRHLKNLLKPIPLETPTTLELAPGRYIRVTLFNANHCTGAVAFLIEDDRHAIMYTGDVRSEQWWVDSLVRHPLLLSYAAHPHMAPLKKLDCMYLDTTFASDEPHCKQFSPKGEGIMELLSAVARYPADTIFYFNSWTFGYEDVWESLSASLRARIHVDDYRFGLYSALSRAPGPKPEEAHRLIGFYCGNHFQEGLLTRTQTRLHSCERGTGCQVFQQDHVRITPIIGRYKGQDILELGAGGGHGDLNQQHELELGDQSTVQQLIMLCRDKLQQAPALVEAIEALLRAVLGSSASTTTIPLDSNVLQNDASQSGDDIASFYDLPIENLVPAIVEFVRQRQESKQPKKPQEQDLRPDGLPKRITFPYSRHSSLDELSSLIKAFQPAEIHPCTVDYAHWSTSHSMSHLFGNLYPQGKIFRHDDLMRQRYGKRTLLRDLVESESSRKRVQQSSSSSSGMPVLGSPFRSPQQVPRANESATGQAEHEPTLDLAHNKPGGGQSDVAITRVTPAGSRNVPDREEAAIDCTTPVFGNVKADKTHQAHTHQEIIVLSNSEAKINDAVTAQAEHTASLTESSPSLDNHDRQHGAMPADRLIPSPKEVQKALRLEAYAAALGHGDVKWDELNLVSVSNDNSTREEAL